MKQVAPSDWDQTNQSVAETEVSPTVYLCLRRQITLSPEGLWPLFRKKKNHYCAPNGWDLNTRQFIATHKFTQATNAFPFNDIVTKTQDFEECSGRETDRKHVPEQAGTCVYMKEKNRLAEKELLNSTWWSRGLSGEHDIRTDRLKEH